MRNNFLRGVLLVLLAVLCVQCARQSPPVQSPQVAWRELRVGGQMQRGDAPSIGFVARLQPPATITAAVTDPALGILATLEIVDRQATFVLPTGQRRTVALTTERMQRVIGLPLWPEQVIALFGGQIAPALANRATITAWRTVNGIKVPQQIRYDDDGTPVQLTLSEMEITK